MGKIYRHPLVQTPLRVHGQLAASNPVIRCAQSGAVCLIYSDAIFESSPNSVSLVTGVESASGIGTIDPTGNALAGVDGSESISDSGTVVASGSGNTSISGVQISSASGTVAANGVGLAALTGQGVTASAGDVSGTTVASGTAEVTGVEATASVSNVVAFVFKTDNNQFWGKTSKPSIISGSASVGGVGCDTAVSSVMPLGIVKPTRIDGAAAVHGVGARAWTGKRSGSGTAITGIRGQSVSIGCGSVKAKGVHNPSDEEIIAIIMEAMVA